MSPIGSRFRVGFLAALVGVGVVGIARAQNPPPPQRLGGVAEVGVGLGFACARTEAGVIWCWGESRQGHLGPVDQAHIPIQITLPSPARRLWVFGDFPVCAELARDGSLWCWGHDERQPHVQRGLESSPGIVELRRSYMMRCALLRDGTVRCSGHREVGMPGRQLPYGGSGYELLPGLTDAVQLDLEMELACARTARGAARCWGSNSLGQLGAGLRASASASPVSPRGLAHDVQDLAVVGDGACAVVKDGAVRCWGEVGKDEPIRFGKTPTVLPTPAPARTLHGGINGIDAVLEDGTLATWGYTALADGKSKRIGRPARVAGVASAGQSTGNDPHFTSTPKGWLCRGNCVDFFDAMPVGPSGLPASASPPVNDPASGFTCAAAGGEVLCRGANDRGQLGDNTTIDRKLEWLPVLAPTK